MLGLRKKAYFFLNPSTISNTKDSFVPKYMSVLISSVLGLGLGLGHLGAKLRVIDASSLIL